VIYVSSGNIEHKDADSLFSGRGSPALMSLKEPALRMLRERYSESFAVTSGKENQIHLFLIKFSLWALVRTFVPKDIDQQASGIRMNDALSLVENALNGSNPELLESLDLSVTKARSRITEKADGFGVRGPPS
jgi:hypothetical protein